MNKKLILKLLITVFLLSVNLFFINSHGTGDVDNWLKIIDKINTTSISGLFPGCLEYDCGVFYPLTYPPGHFMIIYLIAKIIPASVFGTLFSFKLSILFFYFLGLFSVFIFIKSFINNPLRQSRTFVDILLIYLSSLSLIYNTSVLGYTDIYILPFLVMSILFLFNNKYILSGLFFSVSALIKWQPLIILPLFLFSFLSRSERLKNIFLFTLGLIIPLFSLAIINPRIFISIRLSLSQGVWNNIFLSAALNLPWITGEILSVYLPQNLVNRYASGYNYINIPPESVYTPLLLFPKLVFLAVYLLILNKFRKSISTGPPNQINSAYVYLFLQNAVFVFLSYFVLSSGVHENHLISALFLSVILYALYPSKISVSLWLFLEIYNFSNMFLFYGISGNSLIPNNSFGVNPALILSIIFTICYIVFIRIFFTRNTDYLK